MASVQELVAAANAARDMSAETARYIMERSIRVHQDRATEQDKFLHFLQFCVTAAHAECDSTRQHVKPSEFTQNWADAMRALGYIPFEEGNKIMLFWGGYPDEDEPMSPEL